MAFKRKKFLGCLRCSNIRAYGVRYSGEGERLAHWASGRREGGHGRRFARCFAGKSALAREESRLPPTAPGEIAGGGEVRPGGGKEREDSRRRSCHSCHRSSNRGFPSCATGLKLLKNSGRQIGWTLAASSIHLPTGRAREREREAAHVAGE